MKKMDTVSVKRSLTFEKHLWMKVLESISKFLLLEVKNYVTFHRKALNLHNYSESWLRCTGFLNGLLQ